MRWPIRNQILVPFAFMQIVTVVVVSAFSVWLSVRFAEERAATRLDDVLDTIKTGTYPLTAPILEQLHRLSGAHFVVFDEDGQSRGSTLAIPQGAFDSVVLPSAGDNQIESLPVITVGHEAYFAGYANRSQGRRRERVVVLYPESQWREARSQAMFLPLIWGGSVLMLTLLISALIARRFARRVQAVQQHVSRISTGDYQPVPYGEVDDELRSLSQAVNQMAGALEQLLRQARDSERATMLTQLAGGLAHHLRNALTGARVSVQLHQKHCSMAEDEALLVALTQLKRTEEHIKALLRVSQGKFVPSRPSKLSTVLDDVAALVSPLCQHYQVEFDDRRHRPECVVRDADAIRGALLNLLTNAIEAAGPHGYVSLEAFQKNAAIVIQVGDNGAGIPPENTNEIFLPFFTTKIEGVGIGLPVARQAAQDCGGTLSVTRTDGKTVFEMAIPVQQAAFDDRGVMQEPAESRGLSHASENGDVL